MSTDDTRTTPRAMEFLSAENAALKKRIAELENKSREWDKCRVELEEANERLEAFLGAAHELVCFLDHEDRIVTASEAFLAAFQLTGMEVAGMTFGDIADLSDFHHSIFTRAERLGAKVWETGEISSTEELISMPGGEDRLFELVRTPMFHNGGQRKGMVIVGLDITTRVKREFEAQILMAEQSAIFENALIGIVYIRDGRVVRINRTFEKMFMAERERVEGQPLDAIFPEQVCREVNQESRKSFEQGQTFCRDMVLNRGDGTRFWCRVLGNPIESDAMFRGVIWLIMDIEEEKRTQRLREDTERVVRHDLKSPLQAIIGAADLIQEDGPSEIMRSWGSMILSSGYKMLHMIEHSLDLFKMEEGTYVLHPKNFDFVDMLLSLSREFHSITRVKNLKTEFTLGGRPVDKAMALTVSGERTHLESLFSNLVKNGLEASPPEGTVTVAVKVDGRILEMEIHNNGVVPHDVRDRFFDRYATSGKSGGTGLGTYSARLIARVHGGDVTFTTGRDIGTTVRVELPIVAD